MSKIAEFRKAVAAALTLATTLGVHFFGPSSDFIYVIGALATVAAVYGVTNVPRT